MRYASSGLIPSDRLGLRLAFLVAPGEGLAVEIMPIDEGPAREKIGSSRQSVPPVPEAHPTNSYLSLCKAYIRSMKNA